MSAARCPLELPRALPRVALVGALAGVLLLTPWPGTVPASLVWTPDLHAHPHALLATQRAVVLLRLLGPTRAVAMAQLAAPAAAPEPPTRPQPVVATLY